MIKKKVFGKNTKEQLQASINDRLYNFVLADDSIRGVVVNGTRMISEMQWNHELGVLETLVLGHSYLAAALMSANLKGKDRFKLQIECSGAIKGLIVEANAYGEVRGFLKQVPIPIDRPPDTFALAPYFGAGFLTVTKYLQDGKQPFSGKIMMEHGSLAKDLALYYLKSEQIPSAIVLGVRFHRNGEVKGAGGLLLQALPGADEQLIVSLENRIDALPSLGDIVIQKGFPHQWLQSILGEFQPKVLGHRGVEFMCHCNRESIRQMLTMLSDADLQDMTDNGPFPVRIRCHNCNSSYDFSQKSLRVLCEERKADAPRRNNGSS
jgi:molecular chaperone Hsp33